MRLDDLPNQFPRDTVFWSNRELSLSFNGIVQQGPIHRQNCLRIGITDSLGARV